MIQNVVTVDMLNAAISNSEKKRYRVDDVIMRLNDVSPAQDYGGPWEKTAQGRLPIGADSENAVTNTGGSSTHTHGTTSIRAQITGYADGRIAITPAECDSYKPNYVIKGTSGYWDLNLESIADGTQMSGNTDESSNIPPYIAFNFWRKIAD